MEMITVSIARTEGYMSQIWRAFDEIIPQLPYLPVQSAEYTSDEKEGDALRVLALVICILQSRAWLVFLITQ